MLVFLCACKEDRTKMVSLFEHSENILLTEVKWYPQDSLQSPDWLGVFGENILVAENQLEYLLSSYNKKNNSFSRLIKKGQGPQELIDIQTMGQAYDNQAFYVHDAVSKSICFLSIEENKYIIDKSTDIPTDVCSMSYDDSLMFYVNAGQGKHYSVENMKTKAVVEFGHEVKIDNLDLNEVNGILQGLCILSSNQKRIAWFSMYGDVFEIYDYSNLENISLVNSQISFLPIIRNGIIGKETKLGITSLTTDSQYIYALYNENTLGDFYTLKNSLFYSSKILVFDWSGNPYKVLNVDKKIRSISYCENEGILCLGTNSELDPILYQFSLNMAHNDTK